MKDIFSLGELFEKVQVQKIFPDGKTFVDCTPRTSLSIIRNEYENQKDMPGFSLAKFVDEYFVPPYSYSSGYASVKGRPVIEHIEMLWDEITRKPHKDETSLLPLPHPYIVPGGRFREIFYWDSYFTMLGLEVSGKVDMIENMINNFSFLIDTVGYIPNGNRAYFLGRSQPPFFTSMVRLLSDIRGKEVLIKYLPQLQKEYRFWMRGSETLSIKNISNYRVALMPDGSILNHYWDELDTPRPESYLEDIELASKVDNKNKLYRNVRAACESGWDFSSRWFRDGKNYSTIHTTEIIPVDLNCLLFDLEQTIAEASRLSKDEKSFVTYTGFAEKRKEAINKYCWNKEGQFYFDFDYVERKQKGSLTLAATFPLFFNIATQDQATCIAKGLDENFLCPGGLRTTTIETGQQWDSPNGWAPLQWIAIKGLLNYGHHGPAMEITQRWLTINEKVYSNTGKMMEKYNVVSTDLEAGGGEYQSQDGFGWTNGVYLALNKISGKQN